jgi:hypothetical protein
MKSFNDFSLNEESDYSKFDSLVRAGLANKAQLQRMHTILEKLKESENPNLSKSDRMIMVNLFNKMLDLITTDKNIFQKARQAVREENYKEELNEANNEFNSLPPILILKRKAIRLFPNGLKVATYYSDKLKKTFTLPMSDLSIGAVTEETQNIMEGNLEVLTNIVKSKEKKPLKFSDGTSMTVDSFTASAITQVYNAANEDNKKKLYYLMNKDRSSFMKVADFAFGLAKK